MGGLLFIVNGKGREGIFMGGLLFIVNVFCCGKGISTTTYSKGLTTWHVSNQRKNERMKERKKKRRRKRKKRMKEKK